MLQKKKVLKLQQFKHWIGVEQSETSHLEKVISGLGGFISIFAIYKLSYYVLGADAFLIVASMGAATVLLFAVPHGQLSQPWPLIGGNLISATTGVTCALWIPDTFIAAAAGVGLSVAAMHYAKCIHPPGGATALSAVVSGTAVTQLGYYYVITPVLLNVVIIFIVAFVFNYAFAWRRYPASLSNTSAATTVDSLSHEGITHALKQMDSFIDINEDDLNQIFDLAHDFDAQKKANVSPKQKNASTM